MSIVLNPVLTSIDESSGLQKDDTSDSLPSALDAWVIGYAETPHEVARSSGDVISIDSENFQNLAFVDASGDPLDGVASGLQTLDGKNILLYTDPSDDNIVIGYVDDDDDGVGDGTVAFVVYAEETMTDGAVTGAGLWVVAYMPLQHDDTATDDDFVSVLADKLYLSVSEHFNVGFDGAPSGKTLLMTFGDDDTQIVVTGRSFTFDGSSTGIQENASDLVNSSKGGGPTTLGNGSQMINSGQALVFTFVEGTPSGLVVGGDDTLTQGEAKDPNSIQFDDFVGVRDGSVSVVQVQGKGITTIKLTALAANESAAEVQGLAFFQDIADNDDSVLMIDPASVVVDENLSGKNKVAPDVIDNGDGTVTIVGIEPGDVIHFSLLGSEPLDMTRLVVELPADAPSDADAPFDIGGIGIAQSSTDKVDVGPSLRFHDDGPSAAISLVEDAMVGVDETAGVNDPDDAAPVGTLGQSTILGSALFSDTSSFGSDGEASSNATTYSLVLLAAASGLTDTASGEAVTLVDNAGVIEGRTELGDELVFTIEIDAETGDTTLTHYRAIEHGDPDDPDDVEMLADDTVALKVTVTDGDGDSDSDQVNLNGVFAFEDDGPLDIQPEDASLTNAAGDSVTRALDTVASFGDPGTVIDSAGSDGYAALLFSDGSDGDFLMGSLNGGAPEALESGGAAIRLFGFGTDMLVATTNALDPSDTTSWVLTIELDTEANTYEVTMYGAIDNGAAITFDNFGSGKAGLREWFVVDDPRLPSLGQDLLFTGGLAGIDKVNNDADDFAANNQWIDAVNSNGAYNGLNGEAVRISFVEGANVVGDNSTLEGINPRPLDYFEGNDVGVRVMQIQGAPSNRVDIKVTAYDDEDGKLTAGDEAAIADDLMDDAPDEITRVRIEDDDGNVLYERTRADGDDAGRIDFVDDGSVVFLNLAAGQNFFVYTDTGFNYVVYQNAETAASGNDSFALGKIQIRQVDSGDPIGLDFDLELSDGDGDVSSGSFSVTLNPDAIV